MGLCGNFTQIGLQNMIPLCTFCCSRCFCRCFCAELQAVLSLKLPQWDSTGSDLISVIHASFNFWTRHVGLDRRFQTAVDVEERTVGGERFKFGFRWAGPPSFTKITPSSGSKFVLACARKLSKRAAFIPPTASEEDTCESIDERYYHGHSQVSSHLTVCPLSAALYCDLWPSKRCSPIRQDEHRCPIRHGP